MTTAPKRGSKARVEEQTPAERLRAYLARRGLKSSRQRDIIAEVLLTADGHLTAEEILRRARQVDAKVSQATVYRTVKLLTDGGLADAHQFQDGQTLFEASHEHHDHHDHLICTNCGRITEFVDPKIEALQDAVADQHGFKVTSHKMELYGLCPDCQAPVD